MLELLIHECMTETIARKQTYEESNLFNSFYNKLTREIVTLWETFSYSISRFPVSLLTNKPI